MEVVRCTLPNRRARYRFDCMTAALTGAAFAYSTIPQARALYALSLFLLWFFTIYPSRRGTFSIAR